MSWPLTTLTMAGSFFPHSWAPPSLPPHTPPSSSQNHQYEENVQDLLLFLLHLPAKTHGMWNPLNNPFVPINPHCFAYKPNNKKMQEIVQVLSTAPWNKSMVYCLFLMKKTIWQNGVLKLQPSSFCTQNQQQKKTGICTSFIHGTMEWF